MVEEMLAEEKRMILTSLIISTGENIIFNMYRSNVRSMG